MPGDTLLRLVALDPEGLTVISAHVQDAVAKVRDLVWLPRERKFAVGMNRFVWENALAGGAASTPERRRTALHFDRVSSVRSLGFDRRRRDTVLSILAIRFEPGDAPSGHVEIDFAGQGTLRLAVECIEAQLTDLGPAWAAEHRPRHDLSGT
jgi:hypothetical protein